MKKIHLGGGLSRLAILFLGMLFFFLGDARAQGSVSPEEDLPPLLETYPSRPYDILSPVGAGKKTIPEAREQLRREAAKVQAEAVVGVRCESGGVGRQGLTWYNKDAYCRGSAIRYRAMPPSLDGAPSGGDASKLKTWQKDWN